MIKKPDLAYLEGTKFCVVLVQKIGDSPDPEKAKLRCMRGRASIDDGYLSVIGSHGIFRVPPSAYRTILVSDGTPILEDAEYYCFVRIDEKISID